MLGLLADVGAAVTTLRGSQRWRAQVHSQSFQGHPACCSCRHSSATTAPAVLATAAGCAARWIGGRRRQQRKRSRTSRNFFAGIGKEAQTKEVEVPKPIKVDIADSVDESDLALAADSSHGSVDAKLLLICAGFSFDAYTQAERCTGVWACDGARQKGILGVQTCFFSSTYIRDVFRGILRIRPVAVEGVRDVPLAGAAALSFRVISSSPWASCSSGRCSSIRGVQLMDGRASWESSDESVYLYVPRDCSGADAEEQEVGKTASDLSLHIDLEIRDVFDSTVTLIKGHTVIPCPLEATGRMKEMYVELQLDEDTAAAEADAEASEEGQDGEEKKPRRTVVRLQVEYDEFRPATSEVGEGHVMSSEELVEDTNPLRRMNRFRWGNAIPDIDEVPLESLSAAAIQVQLRQRGLPSLDVGTEELRERLEAAMKAEKKLMEAGSAWAMIKDAASSVGQVLRGDLTSAAAAAIWTGLQEIAGVQELLSGDFRGAWNQRMKVFQMAQTEEGRESLQEKAGKARKLAQQVAMLRLAQGMELMSVRRGAWKMLEQAVQSEDGKGISFGEYEQLAYLEAAETNTELWVWRLQREKSLLVTFRGTCDWGDVMTDISTTPVDLGPLGKVHSGFWRAYNSVRDSLRAILAAGCSGSASGWQIEFTGHSLGGALAKLASLDCALKARSGPLHGARIRCVSFGSPRVGDDRFGQVFDAYVPDAWRVYSTSDIIPCMPPTSFFGFQHGGIAVELDPQEAQIKVRGRSKLLAEESQPAEEEEGQASGSDTNDFWSSFDRNEIQQLTKVMGAGTQAVGEHMETNYFQRIQDSLHDELTSGRNRTV